MLKLALKSIRAHKVRFAIITFLVTFGVGAVSSIFMVTDGLREAFAGLSDSIVGGSNLAVRGKADFGTRTDAATPVPSEILGQVLKFDEVRSAEPVFFGAFTPTVPFTDEDKALTTTGAPLAGTNWTSDPELSNLYLLEGELPHGPNEFALDFQSVDKGNFVVGHTYKVVTPKYGERQFKLTGIMRFGATKNESLGAVLTIWDTQTTGDMLGYGDTYQQISIALKDPSQVAAVQEKISSLLPKDLEVVDAETFKQEFNDQTDGFVKPFRTILLVFAFIILFVVALVVNNIFNIVLGQRTRELGLLRALGATAKQVRQMVVVEALVSGILATIIGTLFGFALGSGLLAMFKAFGAEVEGLKLVARPYTFLWAAAVGLVVTTVAALLPARRASKVPPMAAIASTGSLDESGMRGRLIGGSIVLGLGALLGIVAVLIKDADTSVILSALGGAAFLVFIGTAIVSPGFARPLGRFLGKPLSVMGVTGNLARENTVRSPRRTAATAVALTVGLALVSMVAIVGRSMVDTFTEAFNSQVQGDFVVIPDPPQGQGMSASIAEAMAELPELKNVSPFRQGQVQAFGKTEYIDGVTLASLQGFIKAEILSGTPSSDPDTVVIRDDVAKVFKKQVGDEIALTLQDGTVAKFKVSAIFKKIEQSLLDKFVIDTGNWSTYFSTASDFLATGQIADGYTADQARQAVNDVVGSNTTVKVLDQAEYLDSVRTQLNQILGIVAAFLVFAALVAAVGIIATLYLSISERKRELGLLRAVGMTKRQTRRMIRYEGILLSAFGIVLGLALGIVFGAALALRIPDSIINRVSIPVGQLIAFSVISLVFGVIASTAPAISAGRIKILDAIAHE